VDIGNVAWGYKFKYLPMNSFSQQGNAFLDEGITISTHFTI
jgi:hypothetical protein